MLQNILQFTKPFDSLRAPHSLPLIMETSPTYLLYLPIFLLIQTATRELRTPLPTYLTMHSPKPCGDQKKKTPRSPETLKLRPLH